jgi:hypothetical protein
VTYNAIQKVFKSRFDEGRSNARLEDISHSQTQYPFFSNTKILYENLLGKNKESFFNITNFNLKTLNNIHYNNLLTYNLINIYFSDLPFLVSERSDSARYL